MVPSPTIVSPANHKKKHQSLESGNPEGYKRRKSEQKPKRVTERTCTSMFLLIPVGCGLQAHLKKEIEGLITAAQARARLIVSREMKMSKLCGTLQCKGIGIWSSIALTLSY